MPDNRWFQRFIFPPNRCTAVLAALQEAGGSDHYLVAARFRLEDRPMVLTGR